MADNRKIWEIANPLNKGGRPRKYSPKELWEKAVEYFEWIDANPFIAIEFKGKDANMVEVPKKRPYTIEGLCLYLNCGRRYLDDLEESIRGKNDKKSKDYSSVCSQIRGIIYTNKFEGASANFFNPMIIARDLGLAEKREINQKNLLGLERLEETFKELPEAEKSSLLTLAERLGYEDAEFEDLEE